MKRALATVQTIRDLRPIPGADSIEAASVLGWIVVVKKGQHPVGSKVIYMEPDSILPDREEFRFLESSKFRIKTIRLRGQISQGIIFPINLIGEDLPEGTDVTERLGVQLYEPPVPAEISGETKAPWPFYIPRTDEPRIQSYPWLLDGGLEWYMTEKLDGSSTSIWKDSLGEFNVGSRNVWLKESGTNAMWRTAIAGGLREALPSGICVQGEIVGPGTGHGDYLKLNKNKIYAFNMFDIADGQRWDYNKMAVWLRDNTGIEPVPFLSMAGELTRDDIPRLVNMATRRSTVNSQAMMEGIVFRRLPDPTLKEGIRTDSFKVLNPEYLLRIGE